MRDRIRIPVNEYTWKPAIIVMPRGGVFELDVTNEDHHHHMVFMPDNGERQVLDLPAQTRGGVLYLSGWDGYVWALDAATGDLALAALSGAEAGRSRRRFHPLALPVDAARRLGLFAATGRVSQRREPTSEGIYVLPGPAGAKEWPHASYSPATGLLYTPVIDLCGTYKLKATPHQKGMAYRGGDFIVSQRDSRGGHLKAFDPRTGQMVWSTKFPFPMVSSLLSTAGGLVFAGEPIDSPDSACAARPGHASARTAAASHRSCTRKMAPPPGALSGSMVPP